MTAQPAVVAEHDLRGIELGVHELAAVGVVECSTHIEPDRQRLRRAQATAAIEHVAQASAGEVLVDDVRRGQVADTGDAPVVDGGDVGVAQRGDAAHRLVETLTKGRRGGQLRPNQLQGDSATGLVVTGVEHGGVGAGAGDSQHTETVGEQVADEISGLERARWRRVAGCHDARTLSPHPNPRTALLGLTRVPKGAVARHH